MQFTVPLFISIIVIFSLIQPSIEVYFQGEDNTDDYEDLYTKDYNQKELTKMTIQNYYLKEIIKNKQITNQLFEKDKTGNTIPFQLKSGNKIALVMPTFTMAAYDNYKDDSFYTFYKKYAFVNENEFVTTDLNLLSANVPNMTESFLYSQSDSLEYLANRISFLSQNTETSFLTDNDVHNGLVFDDNHQNLYDVIILGHQEYVTKEEYHNFKKFVENGGFLILFNSNIFYAEVAYNSIDEEIILVQGHRWAFDGEKAWLSVLERWKTETSE